MTVTPETQLLLKMIAAGPTSLSMLASETGLGSKQVRNRLDPFVAAGEIVAQRKLYGNVVGCTYAIPAHAKECGAEPRTRTKRSRGTVRPCLCCRRPFLSEGAHNRLCDPCRRKGSDISPYTPEPH